MRRRIRKSVFESNSSSTHSLSIKKRGCTENLCVDPETNKVITHFGEFGWGYDKFTDPVNKLSYLVTMLVETHEDCKSMEELCETEDFKRINDAVAEHCNCSGIIIDEKIEYDDDEYGGWLEHDGYVDHQSVMPIRKLFYDCSVEEFIFDPGVVLIIDNDN